MLNSLFDKYFAEHSPKVDLIRYGNKQGTSAKLVESILKLKTLSVAIMLLEGNSERKVLNSPSILIFDSIQLFKTNVKNIKWLSNKAIRYKHLVYVPKLTLSDVIENTEDGFSIDQVNFLMNETGKSIELVSAFMFTSKSCRFLQLTSINKFELKSIRWNNSNFWPAKNKAISKSYNFKIDPQLKNLTDMGFGCDIVDKLLANDSIGIFMKSVPHNIERVVFAVPPGELYTPLEKFFFMFDQEVWIAIGVTLAMGLSIIQTINLLSSDVQNFVYGSNIKTPTLNMISIFLNGGQLRVPGRNFARFIFVLFIIWSLIIRTCFQSELFKCLQADFRKNSVGSFEELVSNGFTYFGRHDTEKPLSK